MNRVRLQSVAAQAFPLAAAFRIARGVKSVADVVVASVTDGTHVGHGECVPYPRYGETVADVLEQIRAWGTRHAPRDRATLQSELPPCAARNALDCALWDLEAARAGVPVWTLAGLAAPAACVTAYTITLDSVAAMAASAAANRQRGLLKIKLGGPDRDHDGARLRAIRGAAPAAHLIVDANEGWELSDLRAIAAVAADVGVEMIEQPLPAASDAALADYAAPVLLGADESVHAQTRLDDLAARYQVINIKLDKTGGLTEALALKRRVQDAGLQVMVGCMVATSLSMAPALLLTAGARFVDLDGPLLLAADRPDGLVYDADRVALPQRLLWGSGQHATAPAARPESRHPNT